MGGSQTNDRLIFTLVQVLTMIHYMKIRQIDALMGQTALPWNFT